MRLAHLCDMELAEQSALGIASGEQLYGTVQWVQPPQWHSQTGPLAEVQVLLTTEEGIRVQCTLQGHPVDHDATPQDPERYLFLVRFAVEDARYHWLTRTICLAEGLIFLVSHQMQARIFACVHELSEPKRL